MKKKKRLSEPLPVYGFILLSMLVYGLAQGIGVLMLSSQNIAFALQDILGFYYIFFELAPIIFLLIGQAFLFKFQFRWSASRWLLASFGGIISYVLWVMLARLWLPFVYSQLVTALLMSIPILLTGFFQHLVLRRYVQRSWLWILALLVGNTLVVPLYGISRFFTASVELLNVMNFINNAFVGSLQGLFLTVVMIMIFRLSVADTEAIASEQENMTERIDRLDNTSDFTQDNNDDYQMQLQQKSSF